MFKPRKTDIHGKRIEAGHEFIRSDARFPVLLRVVRVFTALDGVDYVQLSRSRSERDIFTVSRQTLLDPRHFRRAARQ